MRSCIAHIALALLYPTSGDRSTTYLPASAHFAHVVHSGEVHFRDPPAYFLDPVAAEAVVAVGQARCSPLVEHAGPAEAVVVLGFAEVVAVGSTARCMPPPDNTGPASAASDPGLAGVVSSTHSYPGVRHTVGHFPNLPVVRSSRCPIARVHPGRSHNRSIAGRNGHHSPAAAAADASAVVVLGRSIAVAAERDCCIAAFWRRYRRAPPMCLS
jgi:hypothetical protein